MIHRPRRPFWTLDAHRIPVLSLYRTLLKTAKRFDKDIHKRFLFFSLRDKFRSRRHETSLQKTANYLREAEECKSLLEKALNGDQESIQHIDDLSWGRKGRLKEVLDVPKHHPFVYDIRVLSSRKKDSHPVYRIPIDPRVYTPPPEPVLPQRIKRKKKRPRRPVVRYDVITSLGYRLWRVRGWEQPAWVSMMMNKRIRQHQKRLDRYQELQEQLAMVVLEQRMMSQLGVPDEAKGFDELIRKELKERKLLQESFLKAQKQKSQNEERDISV
ncbi:450_t:CDS:2 [Paraglomus occultum]|uniref:450_t:CDS:1 n=1 Tax=Paraglomus occultum TaxID=144539 RepID=A0A9N8VDH9_9GLOM|nr:450_t:CDS:2 [Paraglomus occultum]